MEYLIAISIRSLGLAATAWILLAIARVKSPAARHAVWTMVAAGLIAIAIAAATSPTVPVPILPVRANNLAPVSPPPVSSSPDPAHAFPWIFLYDFGLAIATARLALGHLLTRRLVRDAARLPGFDGPVYESALISVPMTVACTILLPTERRSWAPAKLEAVLLHERAHVRRRDWAISVLAALARCLYWFHPLAWWLDRHLRSLAEQACDDVALAEIAREPYARTLVEIAATLRDAKHRLAWNALAMAKEAEIRMRIDRILDDTRPLSRPLTRRRWVAIALVVAPLTFVAALASPARIARAQEPSSTPRYFVQGEVQHPGEYKLVVPTRLLRALVDAEGFRAGARTSEIIILRNGVRLRFDYTEVNRNQNPGQNVLLRSGDIIVVP